MDSLFMVEPIVTVKKVGDIECRLQLPKNIETHPNTNHSWDFGENFPNEVEPIEDTKAKVYELKFPIYSIREEILLISIDENFLSVSPIFTNKISEVLLGALDTHADIIMIGCSDRIPELKVTKENDCTLQPPEFITGFVGALMSILVRNSDKPFNAILAPSEGPQGFEKLSISTMDSLIQLCSEILSVDHKLYSTEVYRRWKRDGRASGAQSGLYL
ncbi:Pba1p [Nakaseomyces bracarensis]|uniref:Pba1p n=1 Tax=Nakaseomyces bracarensis TaxID=273131 RepID=UPI003871C54A